MPERRIVLVLDEIEVQDLERALMDADSQAALEFLRKVLKPKVEKELSRGHCRPFFELDKGGGEVIVRPPPVDDG